MKSYLIAIILVLSLAFLSACEVYNTLYNAQPAEGVEKVPEEVIVFENASGITEEQEAAETLETVPAAEEKQEVVEESLEKASVIIVQETDLVSIKPKAEDPDQDSVQFLYTSPLSNEGTWQTAYGDAGEYTVAVTATDGQLSTSKQVLLIVNKKEEKPVIGELSPSEKALEVDEAGTLDFMVKASDLNKDPLMYTWKLDGAEISGKESFAYKTGYDDAGSHTVKISVSDGAASAENIWAVTVNNINRPPVLDSIADIKVKETEKVVMSLSAADPDGDSVKFTISDPVGDDGTWETTYDDAGAYTVTVQASDGQSEVSQQVKIEVENVNRPPVILDIVQG